MNRVKTRNDEPDDSSIERILASEDASEDALIPSSGFVAAVMERIQEEAIAPPPIPFPWKRAIPGMVLAGGVLGGGSYELVRQAIPAVTLLARSQSHLPAALARPLEETGWVALALAASLLSCLLSWLLSRRLARRSGLL